MNREKGLAYLRNVEEGWVEKTGKGEQYMG